MNAGSGGQAGFAVAVEVGDGALPGTGDQQEAQQQRRQEESQHAVGLQQEVAGVGLPQQQRQHAQVHQHRPAPAPRTAEVRAEGDATRAQVEAPAKVEVERDVEEGQLWGRRGKKKKEEKIAVVIDYRQ